MSSGSGLFSTQHAKIAHLLGSRGLAGEVEDLRKDIENELSPLAGVVVMEFTNPAAATNSGLKTATATVASPVSWDVTQLLLGGVLDFARLLTFTTAGATPANAPASVTITGTDVRGMFQTETLNLAQTAATVTSTKAFKTVTKMTFPAADGTAATIAVGWGASLGLVRAPKSRAGLLLAWREIVNGAEVSPVTGVLIAHTTNGPFGMYTPATPANGSNDYAVFYEGDAGII